MLDLSSGMSTQELQDNTFPFFNLEVGDCFLYDSCPYMKIGTVKVNGEYIFPIEKNAIGLSNGIAVSFSNNIIVTVVPNPFK